MKPLVSVIIPVYQVEKYLDKCIYSVINQTYKNIEIILIDDGSKDNSSKICDKWLLLDQRIKVLHCNNGGGGKSRNRGLNKASGEFIVFVDSDDYIHENMIECLYSYFSNEVDIVECDYIETFDNNAKFEYEVTCRSKLYTSKEALIQNINDCLFKQVVWNKMYRKDIINNIRFPEGKIIDDEFWTYRVIGNANKLIHIDQKLYAYRQRKESIMHSKFSLDRYQIIEARKDRLEFIRLSYPELIYEAQKSLWLSGMNFGQMSMMYLEYTEKKAVLNMLRDIQLTDLKDFDYSKLSISYKMWWCFYSISILLTCKIRNFLKIGF